jgi:hypothetical protein
LWRPADHEALLSVLRWIKFDLRCFQHVPCTIPNYKTTMIWDITHVYIYILYICVHIMKMVAGIDHQLGIARSYSNNPNRLAYSHTDCIRKAMNQSKYGWSGMQYCPKDFNRWLIFICHVDMMTNHTIIM